MKVVGAWLTTVVLAGALATSCSINHKSDGYVCTQQSDCDRIAPGRLCLGGYCVEDRSPRDARIDTDAAEVPVDARPDAPQPPVCPSQCTSCDTTTLECKIDCMQSNCATQAVVCPPGWNCDIACNTLNACTEGIDCTMGASCTIACTGRSSCHDLECGGADCDVTCSGRSSCRRLSCGTGACDIDCSGQDSCRALECSDACACDIQCSFSSTCQQITCPAPECRGQFQRGCSSQPQGCDTCQ